MSESVRTMWEWLTVGPQAGAQSSSAVAESVVSAIGSDFKASVANLGEQLVQLRVLTLSQTEAVASNTEAVLSSAVSQKSDGAGETMKTTATAALKTLGAGLGVAPLASAILGLFTGGGAKNEVELPVYTAPAAIHFQGAAPREASEPIVAVDYGQDALPRSMPATAPFFMPAVTVQVQAMDSRSFMDHSDDIARAVREAILNANTLGDVVSEL